MEKAGENLLRSSPAFGFDLLKWKGLVPFAQLDAFLDFAFNQVAF